MKLMPQAQSRYRVQRYDRQPPIEGVVEVELRRFADDGGSMVELLRLPDLPAGLAGFQPAQINYSTLERGVIKAFHLHHRQTDVWFVPPEDRLLIVLVDVRAESASAGRHVRWLAGAGRASLVRIPPGVAHGCRNVGERTARLLYVTDVLFSAQPESCDEGRLPWDYLGREVWETAWD